MRVRGVHVPMGARLLDHKFTGIASLGVDNGGKGDIRHWYIGSNLRRTPDATRCCLPCPATGPLLLTPGHACPPLPSQGHVCCPPPMPYPSPLPLPCHAWG